MKKIIRKLHLYLGLASGLIVFLLAITGCIYVFEKEIQDVLRKEIAEVEPISGSQLSVQELKKIVEKEIGNEKQVSYVNVFREASKAWIFYLYQKKEGGISYFDTIDYFESVYVDPYTGKILGRLDEEHSFFNVIKMLHWSLLLKTSIGQPIVGWSTMIFLFLLLSGIVLWWPRKFKKAKNLFVIRWKKKTSFFRKLMDLHNVLGFYSLFVGVLLALTGMVWAFKTFMAVVYVLVGGSTQLPDLSKPLSEGNSGQVEAPVELVYQDVKRNFSDAAAFRIYFPKKEEESIGVYVQQREGLYYESHQLYYDRYNGKQLKQRLHSDKNAGEKLINANYDLHTGSMFGLLGKIVVFLSSLFCASLPVTGFLMWKRKN